ncbi:hypothetical protein [Bacillus tropicus]|uniref:hypothetical protein n=1 Tax=Bacillus tropicus TaxID=2026188 RepID=UPI003D9A4BD3
MTKLDGLQLTINKDLGELNNKRKELLIEGLKEYYQHHDSNAPEGLLFMYNSLETEVEEDDDNIAVSDGLIITSNEITFLKASEKTKIVDVTVVTPIVKHILSSLLLDEDKLGISLEITHNISIEGSATEKSLELFSTFGINNVKAIGTNFLIDEMNYTSQFTIRPDVKEDPEFICSEKLNYKKDIALEDLGDVIASIIEQFHAREEAIVQFQS